MENSVSVSSLISRIWLVVKRGRLTFVLCWVLFVISILKVRVPEMTGFLVLPKKLSELNKIRGIITTDMHTRIKPNPVA